MKKAIVTFILMLGMAVGYTQAQTRAIDYSSTIWASGGSGTFAPYHIASLNHGRNTQAWSLLAEEAITLDTDTCRRFSWGFGADAVCGFASATGYARYDSQTGQWHDRSLHQQDVWIQQLYAEVKYRGVFVTLGQKERASALLNQHLSSGDLVESGNAMPIPQLRAGFINFQNIPFTKGWLQIQGEVGLGPMTDSDWWQTHFNRYSYHIASDQWYNYKRCYFRTNPAKPLSVTFGMQAAATFAGRTDYYDNGQIEKVDRRGLRLKDVFNILLPHEDGGEEFYTGNHIGSWDFNARYRLRSGHTVKAYFSWPWEDGSGIGRRNGFDGIWGVEYASVSQRGWLTGAVVEYLDFTNHSGPIHYAPADRPGNNLAIEATGGDSYYNNAYYNSYANRGLGIGTPAIMSPLYNRDGYPAYIGNVMRGFHAAAQGNVNSWMQWRLKTSYRRAWGTPFYLLPRPVSLTSVMAEVTVANYAGMPGWSMACALEADFGKMPCDAFGAMITLRHTGKLRLK